MQVIKCYLSQIWTLHIYAENQEKSQEHDELT